MTPLELIQDYLREHNISSNIQDRTNFKDRSILQLVNKNNKPVFYLWYYKKEGNTYIGGSYAMRGVNLAHPDSLDKILENIEKLIQIWGHTLKDLKPYAHN